MSTAIDYGYRVDSIEVDAAANCVRRDGINHVLRYQTFHVLLYLLEHAGRLVPKEELISAIWREAAVTDNALTQCVTEIRKALGDDSRNPTYIKTVSRAGYEFIAQVEAFHPQETATPVFLVRAPSESTPSAASEKPHLGLLVSPAVPQGAPTALPHSGKTRLPGRNYWKLGLLLATVLACAWAIPHLYIRKANRASSVPTLESRTSLAVMRFENESGDSRDNWLRRGLADMMITDMSQSGKLRVVSSEEMAPLVEKQRQAPPASDPVQRIAQAAHVTDYLTGAFASTPGHFRIDIQLHDTGTGRIVYAEHSVTVSSANVLSQVDVLAAKLAAAMSPRSTGAPESSSRPTAS